MLQPNYENRVRFLNTFELQLDDLLERICSKLQLSRTKHELAESHYLAVGKWLSDAKTGILSLHPPTIYPQGSLPLGTTTPHKITKMHDLDFVLEFANLPPGALPLHLLEAILVRMDENDLYKGMFKQRRRCVTLTYKEFFKMDMLPAKPLPGAAPGNISIPQKYDLTQWEVSNPRGLAKFFNERAQSFVRVFNDRKAEIADLPDFETLEEKPPLKLCVQLMKRHRDLSFPREEDFQLAPTSVVLTTLAAYYYYGQLSTVDGLLSILRGIESNLPVVGRLKVENPSNRDEDFGDRWDEKPWAYEAFVKWVRDFRESMEDVHASRGVKLAKLLKELFGEEQTVLAYDEQTKLLEQARKENKLGASKENKLIVLSSSASSQVLPKNNFHGEELL